MPLAAGTRLGPYEVLGLIGTGGMGEVYKAHDTRLDRTVAIKVLPSEVSTDQERRTRFEREARAIASLAHPHICTLHDIGESLPSFLESRVPSPEPRVPVHYLVMEYLAGDTLAERLKRGPLPLAQALDVAAQIAEALDAAHKHGIIHRDLKPGNVMLTTGGAGRSGVTSAKLLDFGLAKLTAHGERPALVGDATAPTMTASVTASGTILGTPQYMAPEQLEGKEADARTDLWALGAILYEMLTGRRAFDGASSASLIAAIMSAQPPALAVLQPLTPPALDRVVTTCLAKDPEARWQSASDVARELRWIGDDRRGQPASAAAARARGGRRLRTGLLIAAGVAVTSIVSVGLTWFVLGRRAATEGAVRHVLLDTRPADRLQGGYLGIASQSSSRPGRTIVALTPDGRRVVFGAVAGARQQLYVRDLDAVEAKPLPGTEGADGMFLSPDGQSVGFWMANTLKKVPLDGGGPPVDICQIQLPYNAGQLPYGASWGDDGTVVFAPRQNTGLWRVSSQGGTPEVLTRPEPAEYSHRLPHVLPGARAVLFTVLEEVSNWDTVRVVVHRFGTPGWSVLVRGAADARYLPTGHLIYFRRGRLMAAPFDLDRLEITGPEVGLLSDVMQATNVTDSNADSGAAQVAASATATLAYVEGGEDPDRARPLVWVDRQGRVEPLTAPPRPYLCPRVSPDGNLVAVHTTQSQQRVWVHDLRVPGSLVPITPPEISARSPLWTRDGTRLVFRASPGGRRGIFSARGDGTEPPQLLTTAEGGPQPASWTPDGDLLCLQLEAKTGMDIWLLSRKGETWSERSLLATEYREFDAQVSPDGRWLAYSSDESRRLEVYVRRFPSLTDRKPVSSEGGTNVVWARNGRELFYVRGASADTQELVVHQIGPDGAIAQPGRSLFRLAPLRVLTALPYPGFDVTPDGRRFVFVRSPDTPQPPAPNQIHLVFNWFEELKARVPAGGAGK
jgi:serine/threonine-protein kinase